MNGTKTSLEPATAADAPLIYALYSDRETSSYSGLRTLNSPAEARNFLSGLLKTPGLECLTIRRLEDGEPVGSMTLTSGSLFGERATELGYAVLPSMRRHGYMKDAIRTVFSYLETGGIRLVYAKCYLDNYRSARLLQDMGFRDLYLGHGVDSFRRLRPAKVVYRQLP